MENVLIINGGTDPQLINDAIEANTANTVIINEFPSVDFVQTISEQLRKNKNENIVVDLKTVPNHAGIIEAITGLLLPMATVVIPSLPEAEVLDRMSITSEPDMEKAAKQIADRTGSAVLLLPKGIYAAKNLLYMDGKPIWFDKDLDTEKVANELASGKTILEIIE